MIRMTLSACIDAPTDKVWSVLANIEEINLWVEPIISVRCENQQSTGIGAVRICKLRGNIEVTEKWVEWDEGSSFAYVGYNIPMVKKARNTWSVKSVNEKTLLTTESEVVLKGGLFGRLLEPMMVVMSKRMGADSLAGIKHLVETGQPYVGKFSTLPRAPIIC